MFPMIRGCENAIGGQPPPVIGLLFGRTERNLKWEQSLCVEPSLTALTSRRKTEQCTWEYKISQPKTQSDGPCHSLYPSLSCFYIHVVMSSGDGMPSPDKMTNILTFGHPRAGRRDRSESVPFIHEKWRRSREVLAPGTGDLERLKKEDIRVKLILRRIRLCVRLLQMISSYARNLGGG